jgi:hypothetical protein
MVDEVAQLISEIIQIKSQYVAEVGRGRRVWPKSIKERIARLDEIGIAPKVIAARTTIPYDTIVLWRYNRRHGVNARIKTGFHQLKVTGTKAEPARLSAGSTILESVTVTVPEIKISEAPPPRSTAGLRLTTPNGFVIDGLNDTSLVGLLRSLSSASPGGSYAS